MLVLTVTQGPDKGAEFTFTDEPRVIIGRGSPHCKLADRMVSHAHARLKEVDGEWFIRDMQSRNGTFVNSIPVLADFKIDHGDEIKVGYSTMRFEVKVPNSDAVSVGGGEVDAIESLNLLPDESEKFETIESLINIPDDDPREESTTADANQSTADTSLHTEANPNNDGQSSDDAPVQAQPKEPVADSDDHSADLSEPVAPQLKLAESKPSSDRASPVKSRKPLTAAEAAGIELIGVLAFDQVTPMVNRQVDGTDLETPMDPAPRANEGADGEDIHEGPANDWKSLVDNTVSTNDGHAWDEDEDPVERPKSAILNDLSREEDPANDATEESTEENDISFEDYIKEQQRAAEEEMAIEKAAATRKN